MNIKLNKEEVVHCLTNQYAPGSVDRWVVGVYGDGQTRLHFAAYHGWEFWLYEGEDIFPLDDLLDHERNTFFWQIDVDEESDDYTEAYEASFQTASEFISLNLLDEVDGYSIEWQ